MTKTTINLIAVIATSFATAQTPETIFAVDARPTFFLGDGRNAQLRWFDAYGRPSTVGIKGRFPDGKRFTVTQRLARHIGDGDPDQADEYFLESPGEWRIGKQLLPFGQKNLIRETALALRLDTDLVFDNAPISFAVVDAGRGRERGIIGRIGESFGLSFAFGEHFAIQDSSLSILRQDLRGFGKARGYQSIYGADTVIFADRFTFDFEVVALRQGHTNLDQDDFASDIRATYQLPNGRDRISAGWARQWRDAVDAWRIDGEFVLRDQIVLMPHVRFGSRGLGQFGTTVRFRL